MIYHISKTGNDKNTGNETSPFLTISKAAQLALPGDTVIVHEGVYREWVSPKIGGRSDIERITYKAAANEKVIIKGSERINNWVNIEGTLWKAKIDNSLFGDYNPYTEKLSGDWLLEPTHFSILLGDVYLNGKSFYQAASLEEVKEAKIKYYGYKVPLTATPEKIKEPEQTKYLWYSEVNDTTTTIYANFHGFDPNQELTEINVRKCCFYPKESGLNYITVQGFEMAHAACPWAPPTADQPGLLGTNWSKGWIIENNIIHDAKCSGISIGKDGSTGDMDCTKYQLKPGYQYQMEAVFKALQNGWSKETKGGHIIRNNEIYDCGQNGIVGHMGCVFSEVYNNHIYNIAVKHEYFGYEIAGIKFHAFIDGYMHHNRIHDCTLGFWMDWEAQGTRISSNILYNNDRDGMIEVTSGPCIVDNNIFASAFSMDNYAQGTAFVNNLICGIFRKIAVLDRATPYHFPHTTQVAGYSFIWNGDDRYYNNIFCAVPLPNEDGFAGLCGYNGHYSDFESYHNAVIKAGNGDHEKFPPIKQPVYAGANLYLKESEPFDKEKDSLTLKGFDPQVKITEDKGKVYLEITLPENFEKIPAKIHSTDTLGNVRINGCIFDNPNGEKLTLDTDMLQNKRNTVPKAGPIENLHSGKNQIQLA